MSSLDNVPQEEQDTAQEIMEAPQPAAPPVTAKRKKRRRLLYRRIFIFFTLIMFILMFVVIIRLNSKIMTLSERLTASEEYIAAANSRVYEYAQPGDVVLIEDRTYGETWLKAMENVPLNSRDYSNLVLEDGRYTYYENGEPASRTGIDVSYHQGDIDWERVAADGIDFVMVRLGYRGYETGLINEDERAREYIDGALAAGLDVGAYFYSQAVTESEAVKEAQFVTEMLEGLRITYPVVFDWEVPGESGARTSDTSTAMLNKCAAAFCSEVSAAGYTPMIYSGLKMALSKFDMNQLYVFDFWYVEYKDGHNPPEYPYEIQMWQYASDGRVDGIEGDVDMNICFEDYRRQYDILHPEE